MGERLAEAIQIELADLDMKEARLTFNIVQGKLTANGMDSAELLISPNPGEELRPLAKIASGGELSRIMLAIKSVTAKTELNTMIFDEIDTGVSGRAAAKIGRKLKTLSNRGQAIAVTHLAQIAVAADNHLLIEKHTNSGRTYTTVKTVTENERIREIARIQVGDNITELALQNAKEQLSAF
jgi:DNA repair protein RecN (Recombination protein N)